MHYVGMRNSVLYFPKFGMIMCDVIDGLWQWSSEVCKLPLMWSSKWVSSLWLKMNKKVSIFDLFAGAFEIPWKYCENMETEVLFFMIFFRAMKLLWNSSWLNLIGHENITNPWNCYFMGQENELSWAMKMKLLFLTQKFMDWKFSFWQISWV